MPVVVSAKEVAKADKPPVRGAIQRVDVVIRYGDGRQKAELMPEERWPYQVNNMAAWFDEVVKMFGDEELWRAIGIAKEPRYEVNNGKGSLKGRRSSENLFTYYLMQIIIDVKITTLSHAMVSKMKQRRGYVPNEDRIAKGLPPLGRPASVKPMEDGERRFNQATGQWELGVDGGELGMFTPNIPINELTREELLVWDKWGEEHPGQLRGSN